MNKILLVAAIAVAILGAAPVQAASVKVCLDIGTATYGPGGDYTYYETRSGRTWNGRWSGSPRAGRSVHVRFPNGRTRTDKFTMVGGQLYLTNRQGERYRASYCD